MPQQNDSSGRWYFDADEAKLAVDFFPEMFPGDVDACQGAIGCV